MNKFPCTSCGACCRRIKYAVDIFDAKNENSPFYFPYKWDQNGGCENLTTDNRCKVYENRPLICNVDRIAKYMNLDTKKFYGDNIRACNLMMDADGIPLDFRIPQTDG